MKMPVLTGNRNRCAGLVGAGTLTTTLISLITLLCLITLGLIKNNFYIIENNGHKSIPVGQ